MAKSKDPIEIQASEFLTTKQQGKLLNRFEAIDLLWRKLAADDPDWVEIDLGPELNAGINREASEPENAEAATIEREKDELRTRLPGGVLSLGPVLRLILIRTYLRDCTDLPEIGKDKNSATYFAERLLANHHEGPIVVDGPRKFDSNKRLARYNRRMTLQEKDVQSSKLNAPGWPFIRTAMVRALNTYQQQQDHFTVENLFDENLFCGPGAAMDFWDSLSAVDIAGPRAVLTYVHAPNGTRQVALDQMLDFASDATLAEDTSLLATVSSNGSWRDGAAFAQTLEVRLIQDRPLPADKIMRIPLACYSQSEAQNPNAAYAMSYDDVVETLAKAFGVEETLPAREAPYYDLIPTIRAIRNQMATDPRIIIFEGYYAEEGAGTEDNRLGSEILRIARDDHFKGLLLRLLEPALTEESDAEPHNINTFRKNRFIVIANRPLGYFQDETRTGAYTLKQIAIDPPSIPEMRQILERCELRYKEVLLLAFDPVDSPLRNVIYEPVYDLLDKILILVHGPDAQKADAAKVKGTLDSLLDRRVFTRSKDPELCLTLLMSRYLILLKKKNPAVFELHLLLALVPGGLRHVTLLRLARRCAALMPPSAAHNAFEVLTQQARSIAGQMQACSGTLITSRQVDLFHGLDDRLPVFETSVLTDDEHWDQKSISGFDIEDPILKECLNRAIIGQGTGVSRWLTAKQVQFAHRMLAEEALSQQTLGFRQRGIDYTPSFRSYRRLISAIYHGLCSVPLRWKNRQLRVANRSVDQVICPYFAGSRHPKTFYAWIYVFLYRFIIERAPSWELSRRFALDRLKVDLLEVFDAPWKLQYHPEADQFSDWEGSLIEATFSNMRRAVVVDFLVNYSYALTALGQSHKAAEVAKRLRRLDQDRVPQGRMLELTHRKIGMNAEMQSENINIPKNWDSLWTAMIVPPEGPVQDRSLNYPKKGTTKFTERLRVKVEAEIDQNTAAYWEVFQAGAGLEDYDMLPSVHAAAADLFKKIGAQDPRAVAEFSRILFQLSDITAEEADLLRSFDLVNSLEIENTAVTNRLADLRRQKDGGALPANPYRQFCRSLAIYKMAEQLRMEVFKNDPLGGHFIHSGRAARANIRTCLVLEREARKTRFAHLPQKELLRRKHRLGLFSREARRTNDRVTRHLFRYPRERANLQIIEASSHRMLSELPVDVSDYEVSQKIRAFQTGALEISWRYLYRAENIVLGLSRKNSIRRHFALERIKLHMAKVDLSEDLADKKKHLEHAMRDARYLTSKAYEAGETIWIILAATQQKRVEECQSLIL